ncbi:hypothetical protein [Microbacterium xylanilyticum]
MTVTPDFRMVMLALGTPNAELDDAWQKATDRTVTAEELAAAKRIISRMTRVAPGEIFDAAHDDDVQLLERFGKPRPVHRARGRVSVAIDGEETLDTIRGATEAIERMRLELGALESRRLGLMVDAVNEDRLPVTVVAAAAGITRERYYQLLRAAQKANGDRQE